MAYKNSRWRAEDIGFDLEDDMSEGGIATLRITTPVGQLKIMGVPSEQGKLLVLRGVHISSEGIGPGDVGLSNLNVVANRVMKGMGYDGLYIEGEVRTTGARKGIRPRPFRYTRNDLD